MIIIRGPDLTLLNKSFNVYRKKTNAKRKDSVLFIVKMDNGKSERFYLRITSLTRNSDKTISFSAIDGSDKKYRGWYDPPKTIQARLAAPKSSSGGIGKLEAV